MYGRSPEDAEKLKQKANEIVLSMKGMSFDDIDDILTEVNKIIFKQKQEIIKKQFLE